MARRLAVLIDGENICGEVADELFETVATLGEAPVRRIYGNFSNSQARTWMKAMSRHGIIGQQVCSAKNAADIALIVDAVDMLHGGRFDGFCIVSGDQDFAPLATRIREKCVSVYGFYDSQPLESVRASYTEIFHLERSDPATLALEKAVHDIAVDGWALLSKLGQFVRPTDYNCRSLKKLVLERKKFELHPDGQRVKLVS